MLPISNPLAWDSLLHGVGTSLLSAESSLTLLRPTNRSTCPPTPMPAVEIVADPRISSSTRHYVLTS
jgi:hypothetical protein